MQKLQKITNMSGISSDTVSLLAKSRSVVINLSPTHVIGLDILPKSSSWNIFAFHPLELLDSSPKTAMENIDLVTTVSDIASVHEQVATNTIKQGSIGTFSATTSKMTSRSIEEYGGESYIEILLQMFNTVFIHSKRRSKLKMVNYCVIKVQNSGQTLKRKYYKWGIYLKCLKTV